VYFMRPQPQPACLSAPPQPYSKWRAADCACFSFCVRLWSPLIICRRALCWLYRCVPVLMKDMARRQEGARAAGPASPLISFRRSVRSDGNDVTSPFPSASLMRISVPTIPVLLNPSNVPRISRERAIERLADFLGAPGSATLLTGAGVSVESGIRAYRGPAGRYLNPNYQYVEP
jgi:hypothetical protein